MRRAAKILLAAVCRVVVAPVAYPVRWIAPLDGRHVIFQLGSHAMSLLPGLPGVYLRREYYKVTLGLASRGFVVEFGAVLNQRGIEIGNDAYIGPFCNIGLSAIGDDVLLGSGVDIVSGRRVHHFDRVDVPIRLQGGELRKIRIGRDTWIGNKAVVLEDVAEGSVIGAGAVVTRAHEPYSVLAGNPAKVVRKRGEPPKSRSERLGAADEERTEQRDAN